MARWQQRQPHEHLESEQQVRFPYPNLFIVGDEKQAIYRFQGASLENFLYFKKKFPSAREIILEENYRSTQTILDTAHNVMFGGDINT